MEYLVLFWFSVGLRGVSFLATLATVFGESRLMKDRACMTVSARSSFFLCLSKNSTHSVFVSLMKARARSILAAFRAAYLALPGPATSGTLKRASQMITSRDASLVKRYA